LSERHRRECHRLCEVDNLPWCFRSGNLPLEGQPLRHVFDDWPRLRADPSALAWGSYVEDSDRVTSNPGAGAATTTTRQNNPSPNNK
jgi:hypothetical protein